ncbi:hypothetical protein C1H46_029532 [Malus baccata]|uniref:Late embryogenesis abundant protein LEA-2 subgroup domain-containing protein n=1 Tax=Malus baccata TaxID=106549 RepID=A0A540LF18_MALBA|nr:hypothetical protein C1H46_029532 [Malus baccata]
MDLSKLKTMLKQKPVLASLAAIVVLVAIIFFIMLILGLTNYKPKDPITLVDALVLRNLEICHHAPKLITMVMSFSIKNGNKVAFKPSKGTAILFYKGVNVGEADIEVRKVAPGATISTNVTLTALADRLMGNPAVSYDMLAGSMPFNTFTKVPGKVKIFGMAKVAVTSTNLCGFDIDIRSKTVGDYSTDLIMTVYMETAPLTMVDSVALRHLGKIQANYSSFGYVLAGTLPFNMYIKISGRLNSLLKLFKYSCGRGLYQLLQRLYQNRSKEALHKENKILVLYDLFTRATYLIL